MKKHENTGKKNLVNAEVKDSVRIFFKDLEPECEDYASRIVRTRLGKEYLRDDEVDGLRLPTTYTKRYVYEKWVFSCGWVAVTSGADSSYGSIKDYTRRPYDDLD